MDAWMVDGSDLGLSPDVQKNRVLSREREKEGRGGRRERESAMGERGWRVDAGPPIIYLCAPPPNQRVTLATRRRVVTCGCHPAQCGLAPRQGYD